jgi:hypothetical protein
VYSNVKVFLAWERLLNRQHWVGIVSRSPNFSIFKRIPSVRRDIDTRTIFFIALFFVSLLLLSACGAGAQQIVPTARPTLTPTATLRPTETPDPNATPTETPTDIPTTPTFGPSPTALFGPAAVVQNPQVALTQNVNPNAPRIEFFTTDVPAVAPGDSVTLYWSTRGAAGANIYRLVNGVRNQVFPVGPDGSLNVTTRRSDRGALEFLLVVNNAGLEAQQSLFIQLACPDVWFFQPSPDACPNGAAEETTLIEEPFERGRMLYIQSSNSVYALFNDGRQPAWIVLPNRYDAAVHPEFDAEFNAAVPPGLHQPLRILGFVWRGNDTVRNRLGLGVQPEFAFTGFVQTATVNGQDQLYASSADGSVLLLLPQGEVWQIITPP